MSHGRKIENWEVSLCHYSNIEGNSKKINKLLGDAITVCFLSFRMLHKGIDISSFLTNTSSYSIILILQVRWTTGFQLGYITKRFKIESGKAIIAFWAPLFTGFFW